MALTKKLGGVVVRYDDEVDALAVDFEGAARGASVRQERLDDRRAIDFGADGEVVSVEVLGASKGFSVEGLPRPSDIRAAAEEAGLPVFQTVDELVAHYAEGGPAAAAQDFLLAVAVDRRARKAWSLIDPEHRLIRAQAWIWNNREYPRVRGRDRVKLAKSLSAVPPKGPLSRAFMSIEFSMYQQAFGRYDPATWGTASRPRPLSPGLELIKVVNTGGAAVFITEPTAFAEGIDLLMRLREGQWRVASFGAELPTPGWPPAIPH